MQREGTIRKGAGEGEHGMMRVQGRDMGMEHVVHGKRDTQSRVECGKEGCGVVGELL